MNTTALVDIHEDDLLQFYALSKTNITELPQESYETILSAVKFTLYQKRMGWESFITLNIPLDLFILLKGYGKIN